MTCFPRRGFAARATAEGTSDEEADRLQHLAQRLGKEYGIVPSYLVSARVSE